jgi:Fic-DOC domain mobile mystery protein B
MFVDVWTWAGTYRTTEKNIGIEAHRIANDIGMMFDDVRYWVDNKTFSPDEIAIRLHHRLVAIHPFPNGNGRHARLVADLLIERLGGQSFTWGGRGISDVGALRARYITALKAADDHDITLLIAFARS